MIILFSLCVFFGCIDNSEINVVLQDVKTDPKNISPWIGTYEGTCPSYNMKNKDGEDIIIMENYITIPEVNYTYIINNNCSIYVTSGTDSFSCHDVSYTVSSYDDNFILTMKPVLGSDCGGNDIVLTKNKTEFIIKAGSFGEPSYLVKKIEG